MPPRHGASSREDHLTRAKYKSKLEALMSLRELRKRYPQYVWETVACKRLDQGGFEKSGNPHYHVIPIQDRHPDYQKRKSTQQEVRNKRNAKKRKRVSP